jgi:hypothetical protein
MMCEEGMTITKVRNAFSVPKNTKLVAPYKTQSNTGKTDKYCTNCEMKNHNVETCRKKKLMATTEAAQPCQKGQKTSSYACHICDLNGHKMTNSPKFAEM